mmetsp:Transcript_41527/g.81439  ORF Transcript_41527/g.81439 Transcript_41527/m.81439 type:complete len:719 (+) Transcript_41527:72-2228(+)|eukprot:CAMPEP_0175130778 /NCGR_PEP_ID=MMETSP0087-20121206/6184_1 /TAXON_ID=136419 /ORGANISM="Unknown Unknown, Strain D1" /LENGTH=718 /DNA_ID=CAMNT_0016413011 /DNA_START=53 /DNA_END=2209 /DNA_ORIENTATION=+
MAEENRILTPTFRIQLNNPVLKNLVTVGKFDGEHPSLACATSPDNIFIHSPHTRNEENEHEIRQLAVNRRISALACGDLEANKEKARDVLLVGTHTNLLAYDVWNNSDIFYKEVPDGVNSLIFGTIPEISSPLALVGGNCTLQGFDVEGEEQFWGVTGDNVSALAIRDSKSDGNTELLVGSEDYEIRIYQKEEVVCETTEVDVVTGLSHIRDTLYGYALANGTIGVYNNGTRVWHAKSKHNVTSVSAYDLDDDGVPEIVAGWSNGRVEVRNDTNGELVFKDRFSSSIAQVLVADYRLLANGQQEILACSVDGEVRGYLPVQEEGAQLEMTVQAQQSTIQQLIQKKLELQAELQSYESNLNQLKANPKGKADTVAPDTNLLATLGADVQNKGLRLTLTTTEECVIKFAVVFSDTLFPGESMVVHPASPRHFIVLPLKPSKNMEMEVLVKAIVGHRSSIQDHVFELSHVLPVFATFVFVSRAQLKSEPSGFASFNVREAVSRLVLWMKQAFNMLQKQEFNTTSDSMFCAFTNIINDEVLIIEVTPDGDSSKVTIKTDNMELAGDIVQDMCKYLKIADLESVADFQTDMANFRAVLTEVEQYNAIRLRLSADIADTSNLVKTLVIKAEDARMLNDVSIMNNSYAQLYELNRELLGEYTKRANNHAALLKALKDVNQMIQKAARLRMGEFKSRVVASCRKAVKANNTEQLFNVIKTGRPVEA